MLRRALPLLMLPAVIAACSESPDDAQGTYQLAITLRPSEVDPEPTLPSTVHWPEAAQLTLRFDAAGRAQVDLLGQPGHIAVQKLVTAGATQYAPPVENGSLQLGIDSAFAVFVDDLAACPPLQRNYLGSYVELFFLDGHVHGATSDAVVCNNRDGAFKGFVFDITGDRID